MCDIDPDSVSAVPYNPVAEEKIIDAVLDGKPTAITSDGQMVPDDNRPIDVPTIKVPKAHLA